MHNFPNCNSNIGVSMAFKRISFWCDYNGSAKQVVDHFLLCAGYRQILWFVLDCGCSVDNEFRLSIFVLALTIHPNPGPIQKLYTLNCRGLREGDKIKELEKRGLNLKIA